MASHSAAAQEASSILPKYFLSSFFWNSGAGLTVFIGFLLLLHYSITQLLYHCTTLLLYYSTTLLLHYSTTLLLYYSTTLPPFFLLQCFSLTLKAELCCYYLKYSFDNSCSIRLKFICHNDKCHHDFYQDILQTDFSVPSKC